MFGLKHLSVTCKMMLMALSSLFFIVAICFSVLQVQQHSTLAERQAKVKAQVDSAMSIVNYYHQQVGSLGEVKAKQLAMDALRALRYEGSNYLWITNSNSQMLMHPIKPELDGQDLSTFKDVNGKLLFREFSRIGLGEGKGFTFYAWTHPENNQIADKMSYISRMKEWDWIIGSGLWVEDIKATYQSHIMITGLVSLLACMVLAAIFYIVGRDIVKPLRKLKGRVYEISNGNLVLRMNERRRDEVGDVCHGIDHMLDKLHETLSLAKLTSKESSAMALRIADATEESAASVKSQHLQLEQLVEAMQRLATKATEASEQGGHDDDVSQLLTGINLAAQEIDEATAMLAKESHQLAMTSEALNEQLEYFLVEQLQEENLPHRLVKGLVTDVKVRKTPELRVEVSN